MERARTAAQYIVVTVLLLACIYALFGLLHSPYSDQQIMASIVDTWEAEAIGTVALAVAVVVVAAVSLALARRAPNRSVRRLGRIALVLSVAAVGLLCYSHIALTERTSRLTGQAFGAFYGLF